MVWYESVIMNIINIFQGVSVPIPFPYSHVSVCLASIA